MEVQNPKQASTVKVFLFLLLRETILTQDVLQSRNIGCDIGCVVCQSTDIETAIHLIFQCSYAVQTWQEVQSRIGVRIIASGQSLQEIWHNSLQLQGNRYWYKMKPILISCGCWLLWKQRNGIVFNDKRLPPRILADRIVHEFQMWAKFC